MTVSQFLMTILRAAGELAILVGAVFWRLTRDALRIASGLR